MHISAHRLLKCHGVVLPLASHNSIVLFYHCILEKQEDLLMRSDATLSEMYLLATIHEPKTFYIIYKMFIRIIAFVVVTTFPVVCLFPRKHLCYI